jgi:hypothetical protein
MGLILKEQLIDFLKILSNRIYHSKSSQLPHAITNIINMAAVQTSEVKITLALFNAQTLNAVC